MRISSVAAVAACLGMFFTGMGTSYAGGVDKTIKTSALPSATRTTGYPKPDLTLSPVSQYTILIQSYAKQYGVPAGLAHAVVQVESNFDASARGSSGEIGLMQIKPATARMMGYSGSAKDLYDPETNIKFGMMYLAKARELSDGTTCGTILKYNAGHAAKRMNPVSKRYCGKVRTILNET
ncbi:Soluble lytic murein transglycosylase [Ensifer psoraleae]|uniref:lytic transglycosylase domain-containing protein n=1 Tax=Sinorhizobium TaxID=28105 RepID=UPI0015694BB0|nr:MULTISPECIES: transglycosylase SLT domain-containing protein [Sinorhizobium]MDK1387037.1 transglycosylase SLT domain-containing protein [Sinorhizobium sp. 7-81]NRP70466.1 Soluble lytic murein transglycosylase [Sinorhizobium psoraleae]